jgi:oligopeptide/dipeptide ABC transporter ATP-binding protein
MARLLEPTSGRVLFDGEDITGWSRRRLRPVRKQLQMVFQDPYGSLNPRRTVGAIVGEPLRLQHIGTKAERRRRVEELLGVVGLSPEHYNRYPHEFSGGQRQRIGIARALVTTPRLIVADEPVSALDVSIQAQILNLLEDLQGEFGLTYLFIAHDLNVVRHVSDRIAVMYLGKVVELSPAADLYARPIHPYTEALLAAVPVAEPGARERARRRRPLGGDVPSAVSPPPACRFHTRCPYATEICRTVEPPLVEHGGGHVAACHHPLNVGATLAPAIVRSTDGPDTARAATLGR